MYKALTIAGSDSGGGAGIQTDLKTFAAHGVYGTSVITALTAQNTKGVHGIHAVPADFVACQMDAVLSDIPVQAAKTGMLGEAEIIATVAQALTGHRIVNLVVDPVMVAQSGDRLLKEDAVATLRDKLLPLAAVVTPNLPEAAVMLGREINTVDDMETAAREIRLMGPRYVLVKGGHLAGTDMVDIFFDGKEMHRLTEKKLDTIHTHGTGCTYAAAITAGLAKGLTPLDAVTRGKQFITSAIAHGICVGSGYGPTNPMGAVLKELDELRTAKAIREALALLQKAPHARNLLAPGHSNIFYAPEGMAGIASFPAPLVRCEHAIEAAGEPVFDSGHYPAEILFHAQQLNTHFRALINIRFTPELLPALQDLSLSVGELQKNMKKLPDALIIRPTASDEPQLLIFGPTPREAAQKVASLARSFCRC